MVAAPPGLGRTQTANISSLSRERKPLQRWAAGGQAVLCPADVAVVCSESGCAQPLTTLPRLLNTEPFPAGIYAPRRLGLELPQSGTEFYGGAFFLIITIFFS